MRKKYWDLETCRKCYLEKFVFHLKNSNNSFSVTGWRVTSDFSLSIMEEDTAITITCNAISHGHYEDTLIKKDELTLTVLSK